MSVQALPLTDAIRPLIDHQTSSSLKAKVSQETAEVATAPSSSGTKATKRKWAGLALGVSARAQTSDSEVRALFALSFNLFSIYVLTCFVTTCHN